MAAQLTAGAVKSIYCDSQAGSNIGRSYVLQVSGFPPALWIVFSAIARPVLGMQQPHDLRSALRFLVSTIHAECCVADSIAEWGHPFTTFQFSAHSTYTTFAGCRVEEDRGNFGQQLSAGPLSCRDLGWPAQLPGDACHTAEPAGL